MHLECGQHALGGPPAPAQTQAGRLPSMVRQRGFVCVLAAIKSLAPANAPGASARIQTWCALSAVSEARDVHTDPDVKAVFVTPRASNGR